MSRFFFLIKSIERTSEKTDLVLLILYLCPFGHKHCIGRMHARTHTFTYSHTNTHTHTCTHTDSDAYWHTHTHTLTHMKYVFCVECVFLGAQPCWFDLCQWRAETGRLETYGFCHAWLAFSMTSLTQTAGHKMAALTILFSRLSNVDF